MLVLQRKPGERVLIGQDIEVIVLNIRGTHVKLGFSGPPQVPIHREEVQQRINKGVPSMTAPTMPTPAARNPRHNRKTAGS